MLHAALTSRDVSFDESCNAPQDDEISPMFTSRR